MTGPSTSLKSYDAAIVGGGLVGAAIAYGLAKAGKRVAVLDEGDLAVRASRGNFALVWVQAKGLGLPAYARWTVKSSNAWSEFADELHRETGVDLHFDRPGGFHLCLSEAELEARRQLVTRFHNQSGDAGYSIDILSRSEIARFLPDIGPDVVGGSYSALDGHVNSLKLFRALHLALSRLGVDYLPNHAVTAIARRNGAFEIATNKRTVEAGQVVLAAGNANRTLAPMVGLSAPMKPERGQIIVTERIQPFLRHPVVTIRQTDEGTVMIGDSREELTDPAGSNIAINGVMANRAVRMFPKLARLNIVRSWSAIRVMPQDGFPIYDQSASHPGAFVTTCHSGVTLAAIHATALAPMIARGQLDKSEVGDFSARRFDVQAVA
jgi:glycine/D-amino acid oxidase-like deaminating enzyme